MLDAYDIIEGFCERFASVGAKKSGTPSDWHEVFNHHLQNKASSDAQERDMVCRRQQIRRERHHRAYRRNSVLERDEFSVIARHDHVHQYVGVEQHHFRIKRHDEVDDPLRLVLQVGGEPNDRVFKLGLRERLRKAVADLGGSWLELLRRYS